eukprot:2074480-Amphidinium_carterae.1
MELCTSAEEEEQARPKLQQPLKRLKRTSAADSLAAEKGTANNSTHLSCQCCAKACVVTTTPLPRAVKD